MTLTISLWDFLLITSSNLNPAGNKPVDANSCPNLIKYPAYFDKWGLYSPTSKRLINSGVIGTNTLGISDFKAKSSISLWANLESERFIFKIENFSLDTPMTISEKVLTSVFMPMRIFSG